MTLSTRDTQKLTDALQDIPALYEELILIGESTPVREDTETRRGVPGSQLPINLNRLHLVEGQKKGSTVATLTTWTHKTAAEARANDVDLPELSEHPTVWTECQWLLAVRWHLINQDWAEELTTNITQVRDNLRSTLGYRRVWLPSCRNCGDRIHFIDAGGREIEPQRLQSEGMILDHAKCMGCGTVTEPGLELEQLARSTPYSLPEIHEMLGGRPSLKTLYRWRETGIITPVDTRPRA